VTAPFETSRLRPRGAPPFTVSSCLASLAGAGPDALRLLPEWVDELTGDPLGSGTPIVPYLRGQTLLSRGM
jgi:hypothetical protein